MKDMKIGCIGIGVMGSALMEAVIRTAGASSVSVSDPDRDKRDAFCQRTGCTGSPGNAHLAETSDILFLAVKPQYLDPVLAEIAPALRPDTVIVSMAAGICIARLNSGLGGHQKIIRIMPNTSASVGSGMTALAASVAVDEETVNLVMHLLSPSGLVEKTPEHLMDAVTAVSGSGPAYGYLFIDALADAAVCMGLPRAQAIRYAAQTLKGAAEMVLETGKHPAELKDSVCSPAGTTIAAVAALEEHGFRNAVIQAALAARDRSVELGKK